MTLTTDKNHYVVATLRPWNIAQYEQTLPQLPGTWHLITDPEQLTKAHLDTIQPTYIFFPHWSQKVPSDIIVSYECVCFHETDVPYGRGGSPLQNLIVRGKTETVMTALRMVEELDAGPVYDKRPLSLHGLAEEIYIRSARLTFAMIADIVAKKPTPTPQTGEAVTFKRRTPQEGLIPADAPSLDHLFDIVRMLDAEGYPPAYIDYGSFRLEFTRPALRTGALEATVRITKIKGDPHAA